LAKNRNFYHHPSHLAPSFGVIPSNLWKSFTVPEPRAFQATEGEDGFHRFWLIHPCDRQTDGQTDSQNCDG